MANNFYDCIVIGGGPAGMAAAIEAKKTGAKTLLIEREKNLGGILNQCIHNGFGLHYFKEELTGPEYAHRFLELIKFYKVETFTETFVTNITNNTVDIISPNGAKTLSTKTIILATGARERTAGEIKLTGTRPAGVFTAGQVQKMVNIQGMLPCKHPIILGSGDVGLIMARRLTLEGAKVQMVLEIMNKPGGLARNISQCLNDFAIPLYTSTTVKEVVGDEKIKGVITTAVDDKMNPIEGTTKFYPCDALILSVGLIPETDIANVELNKKTKGPVVNEYRETSTPNIFACGNTLHVHDLVDNVSEEAKTAGKNAALKAKGLLKYGKEFNVLCGNGVSYTVPNTFFKTPGTFTCLFRTTGRFEKCNIVAKCKNKIIAKKFVLCATSGTMQSIEIDKQSVGADIEICIEEANNGK